MSTRGFVGIGTAEQWSARYNHFDSYPTGLGREVWATAQRFLRDDHHLHGFARRLLGFTDWRQMATGGICEYCGRKTGHPHTISGVLCVDADTPAQTLGEYTNELKARWGYSRQDALRNARTEWPIIQNIRRVGYPDPEARYHDHDPEDPEASAITPANVEWGFMEWGYVVDPDAQTIHVFKGLIKTPITYTEIYVRPDGRRDQYANTRRYLGALVRSLDLSGCDPDWDAVDAAGRALRDQLETDFAAHPDHPLLHTVRALPSLEVIDQR